MIYDHASTNSGPHAGGNGLLFFAHRIGIDGGNFQDGVAHPLGEQIQGDPFVERMDGIAVAQALGDTMRTCDDVRLFHHGDYTPPRTVIIEFPDMDAAKGWYESDDYAPLRELRRSASNTDIWLVEGV